jgi:hypothetical protein
MLKEGDNGFFTGFLEEKELRNSLIIFESHTIDYITITENNAKKQLTSYIISARK